MMLQPCSILIFLSVIFYEILENCAEFTTEDCGALGYNKANLLCSSCDQLNSFNLGLLKEHCLECCHPGEVTTNIKKYAKARLEVCTCKFGAYPQIQAFVKSDRPAKFPNLVIKYVRGLDPIIKLMDKNDVVQEVLAIERWNTDSVEEFLNTYLEKEVDAEVEKQVEKEIEKDSNGNDYLETNRI